MRDWESILLGASSGLLVPALQHRHILAQTFFVHAHVLRDPILGNREEERESMEGRRWGGEGGRKEEREEKEERKRKRGKGRN